MWETFISWYINTYLGRYVENLNSQQLTFALRQGELELENVPLKKNIFRSWGLPVEVRSGVVGRIRIEFNIFKYFRNEPVLISIEDIYLVAGPLNLSEWDPVEEEILSHEWKMTALDGHEARWKAHTDMTADSSSYYSSLYFSSMRIGASIVTKVVENLQLNVKNVHFRFECEMGDRPVRTVAFGITLESLTAQSCDSQWNPLSTANDGAFEWSYKTLQLSKFGFYCDTRAEKFSGCTPQELRAAMNKLTITNDYILCPVSAEARIAKNNSSNPLQKSSKARFDVHLTLEKVPLQLSDAQYRQSSLVFKAFRRLERNCRMRHYRPFVPINKDGAREWWQYAIRAVLSIRGYKIRKKLKTWDEVLERGRDNVAYVKAYEQHLLRELLTSDARQLKDRIENELHYDEILLLREVAMSRVDVPSMNPSFTSTNLSNSTNPTSEGKQSTATTPSTIVAGGTSNIAGPGGESPTSETGADSSSSQNQSVLGWLFPSWASWVSGGGAASEEVLTEVETFENTPEEGGAVSPLESVSSRSISRLSVSSEKLYQSESEFDEAILDDMKAFGRDALLGRFHFILKQGNVTIKKRSGPFLEFEFSGVDLRTEIRPRSGAHKFQMTLASVFLRDFSTKSLIISPHNPGKLPSVVTSKELAEPLFRLTYERKPQQKTAHRVTVTTKPLNLVIYPILRDDLVKFFSTDAHQDDLELPHSGYEAMKQRTKEEIRTYWERLINHQESARLGGPTWDIIMDISAPQIVIHGANESRGNIKKMYSNTSTTVTSSSKSTASFRTSSYSSSTSSRSTERDVEPFLVIDLGRFRFTNLAELPEDYLHGANATYQKTGRADPNVKDFICDPNLCSDNNPDSSNEKSDETGYSDNEEFLTPCSSPAPEVMSPGSCANSPRQSISDISEAPTIKSPDDAAGTGEDLNTSFGDLQAKLYKKYRLEVTDVQILVVEGKSAREGQWRNAVVRGASHLHLIDKFSINLQLERRLIHTEDPRWPALTLVATLPKWNLHFNEIKILTVRTMLGTFFSSSNQVDAEDMDLKAKLSYMSGSQMSLQEELTTHIQSAAGDTSTIKIGDDIGQNGVSKDAGQSSSGENRGKMSNESKLFLAQFTIQNVTVEIQSRGRSIAELQIIGARTSFTTTPQNTSISFVIQSLLLADAIQTFGPDFQLLLASHKHVSMDSMSGSLRDSEPTSPLSPQSPTCPSPVPHHSKSNNQLAIPSQLHDALVTTLQSKYGNGKGHRRSAVGAKGHTNPSQDFFYESHTPVTNLEALITAELVLVNTDEDLAILSVQFNNLDLIANQETIVEILQFLQRTFPSSAAPSSEPTFTPEQQRTTQQKAEPKLINTGRYRLESSFDFHRLNILLVRGVLGKDGNQCARKIATATASDARVNITISPTADISVDGSLGGLQMLNLTPEGQRHQRVISVGQDPLVDESYSVFEHKHRTTSTFTTEQLLASSGYSDVSALTFSFEKPAAEEDSPEIAPLFKLRMASVIYTHCPTFLIDLKKCISEFQAPLATKLRSAAAQIALGLVRQETGPTNSSSYYRSPLGSLSGSLDKLNSMDEDCNNFMPSSGTTGLSSNKESYKKCDSIVQLDIILDSPVIVLPKSRCSPKVLVANLGQISVTGDNSERGGRGQQKKEVNGGGETFRSRGNSNSFYPHMCSTPDSSHNNFGGVNKNVSFELEEEEEDGGVYYNVFIRDISLYSLDLTEKWSMMEDMTKTFPTSIASSVMKAQDLYYCDPATSIPILHNTVIQISICYKEDPPFVNALTTDPVHNLFHSNYNFMDSTNHSDSDSSPYFGPKLELHGRVVNPLKVSLTPQQYSQILESLNNISAHSDDIGLNELDIKQNPAMDMTRRMRWREQVDSRQPGGQRKSSVINPLPLPSPTLSEDDSLPISAGFDIPELIVELVLPDFPPKTGRKSKTGYRNSRKKEMPHLCLSCSELSVECDKKGYITEMKLNLKSLTLEDTSVPETSPQRFLALSNTSLKPEVDDSGNANSDNHDLSEEACNLFTSRNRFVSSSCPDIPKSVPIFVPETPTSYTGNSVNLSNVRTESSSLPDHLDPSDIFTGRFNPGNYKSQNSSMYKRKVSMLTSISDRNEGKPFCPATPPPSPRAAANSGNDAERFVNLVHITLCLVDVKSPYFISKYRGTHKFVHVDFNALEVLLTPETFICLRKFFSEASKCDALERQQSFEGESFIKQQYQQLKSQSYGGVTMTRRSPSQEEEEERRRITASEEEERNTETKINVKALSVKLARGKTTLAEGRVTGVMCNLVNRGAGFFGVEGRLGSLVVKDVSEHAGKYPVKFTFQGKQALDFDYVRQELDAKFRLQMSSVVCVHTQRFYTEFSSLLSTLFGSLSSMEEELTGGGLSSGIATPTVSGGNGKTQGSKTPLSKPHSVRASLDIQAGAPVLLFPYNSTSRNLLVADLGHLSVRNKIIKEAKEIVYDRISVDLIEMDLFAAELQYFTNARRRGSLLANEGLTRSGSAKSGDSGGSGDILKLWVLDRTRAVVKTCESTSFLKEKCALKLKVKRFLSGAELAQGEAITGIEGTLSTVCCFLDPEKYKLVRGLLEYNIGEKLDPYPQISSNTPMRTTLGTVSSNGFPSNSGESSSVASPLIASGIASAVRKELVIELDLVNVTLELIKDNGSRLSRIDFVKSKFTFQNSSDGTRDIDLASQEILISDARFNQDHPSDEDIGGNFIPTYKNIVTAENVFTNILQQSGGPGGAATPLSSTVGGPASSSAPSSFQSNTQLQAEIHYRVTNRGSSFTIVLNNMRLMLILDWWMELRTFLNQKGPVPKVLSSTVGTVKTGKDDNAETVSVDRKLNASPLLKRSRQLATPVTVSAGIVTKRAPILDVPASTFELKLNVSNCELVVVEDPSVWDSNAIILKSTAVLNYKPHLERPVTCTLLQCELFSCILGLESDTALSIVDPTDINFELVRKTKSEPQGILDATLSPSNSAKILRVQSPQLCLRLSYYDMRMFVHLIERFSKQAQVHLLHADGYYDLQAANEDQMSTTSSVQQGSVDKAISVDENSVHHLVSMGFSRQSSLDALITCGGRLDEAAIYLTNPVASKVIESEDDEDDMSSCSAPTTIPNLTIVTDEHQPLTAASSIGDKSDGNTVEGQLSDIEIKCSFLSLCVIDDCKDADVPLVELAIHQLELVQNYLENTGQAECQLGADYYNRALSGWEPFLEPWKCCILWKKNEIGQLGHISPGNEFPSKAPELELSISSRQVMNMNVTSTLLNLYKTVSSNWSEEYQLQATNKIDRRRAPFVPFLLKNETGSELWFSTILPNNEDLIRQQRNLSTGNHSWQTGRHHHLSQQQQDGTCWIHVPNSSCHPFSFEGRGKLRHRNTHQLRTHQLAVRVDGWHEIVPVSLDKVGTYFRVAKPLMTSIRYGTPDDLPFTRLVFEVKLLGSAQKLVIVRSALLLKNCLNEDIELKLENTIVYPSFAKEQTGGSFLAQVKSGDSYPIPLHSVWAQLWVRPVTLPVSVALALSSSSSLHSMRVSSLYRYCESHLLGNPDDSLKSCFSLAENQLEPYRFCVAVQKDEFPADEDELYRMPKGCNAAAQYLQTSKKVNVVTVLSPLTLVNLLPVEISFGVKGRSANEPILGLVSAGKESQLTNVNLAEQVEVTFFLDKEHFPFGNSVTLNPNTNSYVTKLKFLDNQKRPLVLIARVSKRDGNSITVYLSCPYWIVNKAGIPLVFRQEGMSDDAAGQFQEHEMGRMVAPLLFSFSETESSTSQLTLRVGSKLHGSNCKSLWSKSFYLQNGMKVLKLTVSLPSTRSEIVYVVGIEVKSGRGRYRDSKLVSIAPRFIIDNRSSHKVQISQRNFTTSFLDPAAESTHLNLTPACNLPFHWPRLDKDQLLCVRLANNKGAIWSGGFPIENVDSFHIPVRDHDGACNFLRVEIVLQGPTFFIVLGDTDKLPPPFRVDNFSFVPILFHQTAVGDERLKLTAKAESCCPFAWDEPTHPSHLTLAAPGGTSTVVTMDTLGFASHLTYENFFYIAFTVTFPVDELSRTPTVGMESLQLVLDVEGNKIILRPKENGKRSQLWRVNADGLIEHEGSSPPREPRKPSPYGTVLVLDIAGSGPQPTQFIPLMLRKPDSRRASTQHWEFTTDGRLKCEKLDNLYVQAKDGFGLPPTNLQNKNGKPNVAQWHKWNDVVLGPDQPICYSRTESGIPAEQAVSKQKLRPGSGRLSLTVDTDGPTRVLRIVDVEKPPRSKMLHHEFEEDNFNTIPRLLACVSLKNGLGISIVNCRPREELAYIRLTSLNLKYSDSKESELVEAAVENFQIDNQLLEAEKPISVFVVPTPRYELDEFGQSIMPALHLSWQRMKSKLNAHVFKSWELAVKPLSVTIEERLLLKFCSWIGLGEKFESLEGLQESDFEVQRALTNATSLTAKRFYFGVLSIILNQIRLSVLTSSKLDNDLALIKRRLGLTLIRFEDAPVEMNTFLKQHPFETFDFLVASLVKHYREELVSQAAFILGATDFLGNPLGFVNDVSVGVSGLIYDGSFGSLVKNVTHGMTNSVAKVTGSLGDGLGKTTLDDKHEEERRKIREEHSGSSGEHLVAGLRGLGHGIVGGFTSILAQSYEGASADGITGFVAGLGKGIVGTVTKPSVGILDLATGVALTIRDSSRTSARMVPDRIRPPRVATGHGGLLPVFSEMASRGQELLYDVNDRNYTELFIGCEVLLTGPGRDLRILISSQAVIVFRPGKGSPPILRIPMSELIESRVVSFPDGKFCIELVRLIPGQRPGMHTSPQVNCESESVATRVVQQINYAKVLYEEKRHSQIEKATSPSEF